MTIRYLIETVFDFILNMFSLFVISKLCINIPLKTTFNITKNLTILARQFFLSLWEVRFWFHYYSEKSSGWFSYNST